MKKINLVVLLPAMFIATTVLAADKQHWGYSGESGPDRWGLLSEEYEICSKGKNQSPINLQAESMTEADLVTLRFSYQAAQLALVNNGHAIQLNYPAGSKIQIDGKSFELKQFHFHSPSENEIESKSYPLEAHLVHADADGNLAVVAVMFVEGQQNSFLSSFWKDLPRKAGGKLTLARKLNVRNLLPKNGEYYRFNGSLTTPPCSEGVRWFVMKDAVSVSKKQITDFRRAIPFKNNRPLQSVNARLVLK